MGKPKAARLELVICVLLVVATAAVYRQSIGFDVTDFDDNIYVTDNPHIRDGLTASSLAWALTTRHGATWQPIVWLSYVIDHHFAGLDPAQYHMTNVLLHIANTVFLFLLFSRVALLSSPLSKGGQGGVWRSAFVAGVFALHPLHVESVAWVTERKDVLSTLFWFATMAAYAHYARKPGIGRYALVAAAYVLGLMTKPMLVSLPFVLLLMDYWPLGRAKSEEGIGKRTITRRLLLEKAPLIVLAAAACLMTVIAQGIFRPEGMMRRWPFGVRAADALVAYVWYVGRTFWPGEMAAFYPHPGDTLPVWMVIGSGLLLVGLTAGAVIVGRRRPYVAFGWLFYVVTLLPVAGFLRVGKHWVADRFSYVPIIGLSVVVAWGIGELAAGRRFRTAVAALAACVVLGGMAVWSHKETGYWRNSGTLFARAVEVTQNNALAEYNLALALKKNGEDGPALKHLLRAMKITPNDWQLHMTYGAELLAAGKTDPALVHLEKAVKLEPRSGQAASNLGVAYCEKGEVSRGIRLLRRAVELDPEDEVARDNLAQAEAMLGE